MNIMQQVRAFWQIRDNQRERERDSDRACRARNAERRSAGE